MIGDTDVVDFLHSHTIQAMGFFVFLWMLFALMLNIGGIVCQYYLIKGYYFSIQNLIVLLTGVMYLVCLIVFDSIVKAMNGNCDKTWIWYQMILIVSILIEGACYLGGLYWAKQLEKTNLVMQLMEDSEVNLNENLLLIED